MKFIEKWFRADAEVIEEEELTNNHCDPCPHHFDCHWVLVYMCLCVCEVALQCHQSGIQYT